MDEIGPCVVDANIFVKGVLSPHGPSGEIIQAWRVARRFTTIASKNLLREIYNPKDDYLIESALLGGANYLVTDDNDILGDQRVLDALSLFGTKTVPAIDFLRIVKSS